MCNGTLETWRLFSCMISQCLVNCEGQGFIVHIAIEYLISLCRCLICAILRRPRWLTNNNTRTLYHVSVEQELMQYKSDYTWGVDSSLTDAVTTSNAHEQAFNKSKCKTICSLVHLTSHLQYKQWVLGLQQHDTNNSELILPRRRNDFSQNVSINMICTGKI